MKYCVILLLFCLLIPQAALSSEAYLAWFTDASISEGSKLVTPSGALPSDPSGAKGACVNLTKGCELAVPSLSNMKMGTISFWIRTKEDGLLAKGGAEHIILRAGDPKTNGLQVSWDNAKGTLRFKMAGENGSKPRIAVCRADISNWKANDWHHVQVAWLEYNSPVGLAVWIDKTAVASCIFGGTNYMSAPAGNNVTVGDSTSKAYIDELIFRGGPFDISCGHENGVTRLAYRDYFRTAPFTAIQITHLANKVNSDTWVLLDKKKQFGLTGTRLLNTSTKATTTEYITNYDVLGSWGDFDAKPYITWTASDTSYATIDKTGLVTGLKATTSPITLIADFAGLKASYLLNVKDWSDKPDLCLEYVERTPRYDRHAAKNWSAAGDTVTTIAHIGNFGTSAANNIKVIIEKATDANNNFKVDPGEKWSTMKEETIKSLAAGEETTVLQTWVWPENGLTTGSVFIRVMADPDNAIDEICEANNERCEKSNAKAMHWGRPVVSNDSFNSFADDYNNRVVNLVGSFSDYDWCNAETDRDILMMREAVYPTTTPDGILDSIRVDQYTDIKGPKDGGDKAFGEEDHLFDGCWPKMEPFGGAANMDYNCAIGHEIGHTTMGLPDLYGQCMDTDNTFLKDSNGNYYAGTAIYPITQVWDHMAMYSSAIFDHPDECAVGHETLMCGNNPWLDSFSAGLTHFKRQKRQDLLQDYLGNFGDWIPTINKLRFYDVNDDPLKNARIYIYQIANTEEWYVYGNRYYPDRPKFILSTDSTGCCTIPTTTCEYWDDYTTDAIDGAIAISTPFAVSTRKAMWHTGATGDVFLIKVIGADNQVEIHPLPLTEFNAAYFSGLTDSATYSVRTSVLSPSSVPAIEAPKDPAGGRAPVLKINYNGKIYTRDFRIAVPAGTKLTFDGSLSTDPEGFSPLRYRWSGSFSKSDSPIYTVDTTGRSPGDYEMYLYIIDSVRFSPLHIEIRIQ